MSGFFSAAAVASADCSCAVHIQFCAHLAYFNILKKILYTVRLSLALSPTVTVDSLYDDPMLSTWLLVRQSRIRLAGISRLAMA